MSTCITCFEPMKLLLWPGRAQNVTFCVRYGQRSCLIGAIFWMQYLFILKIAWTTEWLKNPLPLNMSGIVWNALLEKLLGKSNKWIITKTLYYKDKLRCSSVVKFLVADTCLFRSMIFKTSQFACVKRQIALTVRPSIFVLELSSFMFPWTDSTLFHFKMTIRRMLCPSLNYPMPCLKIDILCNVTSQGTTKWQYSQNKPQKRQEAFYILV